MSTTHIEIRTDDDGASEIAVGTLRSVIDTFVEYEGHKTLKIMAVGAIMSAEVTLGGDGDPDPSLDVVSRMEMWGDACGTCADGVAKETVNEPDCVPRERAPLTPEECARREEALRQLQDLGQEWDASPEESKAAAEFFEGVQALAPSGSVLIAPCPDTMDQIRQFVAASEPDAEPERSIFDVSEDLDASPVETPKPVEPSTPVAASEAASSASPAALPCVPSLDEILKGPGVTRIADTPRAEITTLPVGTITCGPIGPGMTNAIAPIDDASAADAVCA
jgi:hypothetical protein